MLIFTITWKLPHYWITLKPKVTDFLLVVVE